MLRPRGVIVDRDRESEARFQEIVREAKAPGCRLCRSLDKLHFHHINPKEKYSNIDYTLFHNTPKTFWDEMEKCVVLCHRCHSKVHTDHPPPPQIVDLDLYYLLQQSAGYVKRRRRSI